MNEKSIQTTEFITIGILCTHQTAGLLYAYNADVILSYNFSDNYFSGKLVKSESPDFIDDAHKVLIEVYKVLSDKDKLDEIKSEVGTGVLYVARNTNSIKNYGELCNEYHRVTIKHCDKIKKYKEGKEDYVLGFVVNCQDFDLVHKILNSLEEPDILLRECILNITFNILDLYKELNFVIIVSVSGSLYLDRVVLTKYRK